MKVTGSGPSSADKARETTRGTIGTSEKRRSGRTEEADSGYSEKVAISSRAKDAAKAMEAARSAPDIDEAKVAKFKAAIQNGSYKVDADKVADRMFDEHLATLS